MKLSFNKADVQKLIDHAKSSKKHRLPYGKKKEVPGLMLVGDQGIYLMSSGIPHLPKEGGKENDSFVVYPKQCDPTKMEFDDWWEAKRAAFGGDDGVEFLPLSGVEESLRLNAKFPDFVIMMTPQSMRF